MSDAPLNNLDSSNGLAEIMRLGLLHFRSGRAAEAEKLCGQVISRSPENAEALHLLGILTAQAGDVDGGIELLRRCVMVRPDWSAAIRQIVTTP